MIGCSTVAANPHYAAMWLNKLLSLYGITDVPIYVGPRNTTITNWSQFVGWPFPEPHYNYFVDPFLVWLSEYSQYSQGLNQFPPPPSLFNSADIVFAIGPSTNLGILFRNYTDYTIKHLISQGASLLPYPLSGLTDEDIIWDYNLRIDPEAAWILMTSPNVANISFIPANITLQCYMDQDNLKSMIAVKDRYEAYPTVIRCVIFCN